MATMTGLLAMAAMGIGPAADPCDEAISVQVRVLDMDGLGWRSDAYARLRPVTTRGTSAVWTADRALLDVLAAGAKAVSTCPRRDAVGEAVVSQKKKVHYVANVDRVADGPINHSTKLAYRPETSFVEVGTEARVHGRKLDQGVLARVALEDSRVLAMHTVKVGETVASKKVVASAKAPAACSPLDLVLKTAFRIDVDVKMNASSQGMATTFQIPEVARTEIEGEWLIPTDGVLVVSLGIDTVADEQGRAVARERLAVLEVLPDAAPMPIAVSSLPAHPEKALDLEAYHARLFAAPSGDDDNAAPPLHLTRTGRATPSASPRPDAVVAASFEAVPEAPALPSPSAPSRSLPVPVDADGRVIELPPLPIAASTIDHAVKPAANQPSPQTIGLVAIDPAVSQASFTAPAPGMTTSVESTPFRNIGIGRLATDEGEATSRKVQANLSEALKAPGKTETVRVPLGGNLALEIKATVVPATPDDRDVASGPGDATDRR